MKRILIVNITIITLLFACKSNKSSDNNSKQTAFSRQIDDLKKSKIDSILMSDIINKKLNVFSLEHSEIEADYKNNKIDLHDFKAIHKSDVLKITPNYILLILHNPTSNSVVAATFQTNGDPIQSILLYKTIGNNEYHLSRAPSIKGKDFLKYDSKKNEFYFVDARFDTEWIDYPTKGKDVLTSAIAYIIRINTEGKFSITSRQKKSLSEISITKRI